MGANVSSQPTPADLGESQSSISEKSAKKGKNVNVDIRENKSKTEMVVKSYTWHRDSHGLFDYESKNITSNYLKCNYSTTLYRVDNDILFEELKIIDKVSNPTAIILEKDSFYWMYHKNSIDDTEDEKLQPANKAWLIVKYINTTGNFNQRGYKIKIGDTLKFGRVRFKVIMLNNELDGELIYKVKKSNKKRLPSKVSLDNTDSENDMEYDNDENQEIAGGNNAVERIQNEVNISARPREGRNSNRNLNRGSHTNLIQGASKNKKKDKKGKKQNKEGKDNHSSQGGSICRICLGEENEKENPLITPCKCDGTMGFIHIDCLREWLNSKSSQKENSSVKTYCWKALECELCKVRFPDRIFSETGQCIDLISFEKPSGEYIVLESVTQQNIKIIHVIDMDSRSFIKVGRGHDTQVRITDISVSRCHSFIKKSSKGDFILEDNNSKFGTLIQVRKPLMLQKNHANYLQLGRTVVEVLIKDPTKSCSLRNCCSSKKQKTQKGNLAFDGEDFFPDEFLAKQHEYTREEENLFNNQKHKQNTLNRINQNINQAEEQSVRRSQALENMTEQARMHDEAAEEEYEDANLSPDNYELRNSQEILSVQQQRQQQPDNQRSLEQPERQQSRQVFDVEDDIINDEDQYMGGNEDLENSQSFLNVQHRFEMTQVQPSNHTVQIGFQQQEEEFKDHHQSIDKKSTNSKNISQGNMFTKQGVNSEVVEISMITTKNMKKKKSLKSYQNVACFQKESQRSKESSVTEQNREEPRTIKKEMEPLPALKFYQENDDFMQRDEDLFNVDNDELNQTNAFNHKSDNNKLDLSNVDISAQQILLDNNTSMNNNNSNKHQQRKTVDYQQYLDQDLIKNNNFQHHNLTAINYDDQQRPSALDFNNMQSASPNIIDPDVVAIEESYHKLNGLQLDDNLQSDKQGMSVRSFVSPQLLQRDEEINMVNNKNERALIIESSQYEETKDHYDDLEQNKQEQDILQFHRKATEASILNREQSIQIKEETGNYQRSVNDKDFDNDEA